MTATVGSAAAVSLRATLADCGARARRRGLALVVGGPAEAVVAAPAGGGAAVVPVAGR